MQIHDELEQWLREQPLNAPVEIDGETVYLRVHPQGAELGAILVPSYTQAQLQDALRQGFSSAIFFDAGLGLTLDGRDLVLTQWLPYASAWFDAVDALEKLLNQVTSWRASIAPAKEKRSPVAVAVDRRGEQRPQWMYAGAMR